MQAETLQRLAPVLERLKAALGERLTGVVLFGSRARAKGRNWGDWDLFLLAEDLPENPFDRQMALRALLPPAPERVSLLAKTRGEFEGAFPPLYLDIAADGIVLYDPQGYLRKKLTTIREIIKAAGLRRTRRNGDLIWKWEKPPRRPWRIDWTGIHGLQG